jgi:hypothetical protein
MKRRASPAAQGKAMLLWPFGVLIALAAFPIIWLLLAVIFWMTNRWVDWPTSGTSGGLLYLAVAVVLVPIVLLILDAVARGGGSFTVKSVGINFGSGVRATEPPAVEVQTSLGFEGQPINDSMVASVHQTLNEARANDIVRIDLGVRRQLWLTRLFALSYGATRTGAPKLFVLVGRDSGVDHAFLGRVQPRDAVRLLREQYPHLRLALDRGVDCSLHDDGRPREFHPPHPANSPGRPYTPLDHGAGTAVRNSSLVSEPRRGDGSTRAARPARQLRSAARPTTTDGR